MSQLPVLLAARKMDGQEIDGFGGPMMHRWIAGVVMAGVMLVSVGLTVPTGAVGESRATTDLALRQKDRVRALGALAADAPAGMPFRRIDPATGIASIVLTERPQAYTLHELMNLFAEAFESMGEGVVLLKDDVVVGEKATLSIGANGVRELRLLSTSERFVTITSWRGSIAFDGSPLRRLTVVSWDPGTNQPDELLSDGRAWIHARRGRMDVRWTDMRNLGFFTGSLSGVAWEGRPDDRSRGDVVGSRFRHNFFGAYTFEALAMRWLGNEFSENHGYGFDPHDQSNDFVVRFNVARNNGDHGIIFSRGCQGNRIEFNASYSNGRHGIVLDDGPNVNPDGTPRERQAIPSDMNIVRANAVWANEVGIVLDGGTRNAVRSNLIVANNNGVRMKDAVNGNWFSGNLLFINREQNFRAYNGSDRNYFVRNIIIGGGQGFVIRDSIGNVVEQNYVIRTTREAISLEGYVAETRLIDNWVENALSVNIATQKATGIDSVTVSGMTMEEPGLRIGRFPFSRWLILCAILLAPVAIVPGFSSAKAQWHRLRLT